MQLTNKIDKELLNDSIKEIKIFGYTKIKNYLTQKGVNELKLFVNQEFSKFKKTKELYKGLPERDSEDKVVYNLQNLNKKFIDVISTIEIKYVLKSFLNDKYYGFLNSSTPNYILNYFNARSSGLPLDYHIDSHIPYLSEEIFMMQAVILLDQSNKKNGCTKVIPGSHLSGKYTDRSFDKHDLIEGEPGDLIFWDSRLWHGTLGNISKKSRWAIIATFSRWWIKQSSNITSGLRDEIYKKLDNEQKQLLGFCSIPPKNQFERINTKCGYDFLKNSVSDY